MVDFSMLLGDISAESPSGDNLEYDPAYIELERLSQHKEEVQYGTTVVEAEEPDWKAVIQQANSVLERTRDLRVAAILAPALLRTGGMLMFADSLAYIADLLEQRWETVHPQLDPDDDNDPTLRVNSLASLCAHNPVLRGIRNTPLIVSRAVGKFSLRDLEIAKGEVDPATDTDAATRSLIEGAIEDVGHEEFAALVTAITGAVGHVERIERVLTDKVGNADSIDLTPLSALLRKMRSNVQDYVHDDAISDVAAPGAAPPESGRNEPVVVSAAPPGSIENTEDVKKALDKICEYYRIHEPSSPIPLLLNRAKGLVAKDFFQIIEDLAPDAVDQVQRISGSRESE